MDALKIGPTWACAALLAAMTLVACGDDGGLGTSSSGGGDDNGSGGNDGNGGNNQGPSSSASSSPTSSSTSGDPTATATATATATSTGPGSGGEGPGSGGEGPGSGGEGPGSGGEGPGSGGEGPGSGGDGPGVTASASTAVASTAVASTAVASVSTGGNQCEVEDFFIDPVCDTCATNSCCDEMEACLGNVDDCADFDGNIDPNTTLGGNLIDCLDDTCLDECFDVDGVCGSGLSTQDPNLDACIDDACCADFSDCFGDGSNPNQIEACNDCIEDGGGALCNGYLDCFEENCGGSTLVCESGLEVPGNPQAAQCLSAFCCDEFTACTGSGSDADILACLECLDAPNGGPLCDAALECNFDFGCL